VEEQAIVLNDLAVQTDPVNGVQANREHSVTAAKGGRARLDKRLATDPALDTAETKLIELKFSDEQIGEIKAAGGPSALNAVAQHGQYLRETFGLQQDQITAYAAKESGAQDIKALAQYSFVPSLLEKAQRKE